MLNLNYLVLLPIIFISILLLVSLNKVLKYKGLVYHGNSENGVFIANNLDHVIKLEEKDNMLSYILQGYYSNIKKVNSLIFPSLRTISFSRENLKLSRDKWEVKSTSYLNNTLKRMALLLSLVLYFIILLFWFKYSRTTISYQLLTNINESNQIWNMDVILGIDGVSLPFLLLIGFVIPLVFISNWSSIDSLDIYYLIIIILLELFLIIVFLVIDLIMFYIFFESILPPLFILIGLYGASQKFRAGYYLFLYTLFGSLFMLLSFLKMGSESAAFFYETYGFHNVFRSVQFLMWIMLFISFSVKTPLVPVHTWLPLAHSDANVSGSIILASIVLKLALYGFLRILIGIFFIATSRLVPFFLGLCGISLIYSSFTTIRQFDLKVLVAYSSIAHMASTLLGTFSDTLYGIIGSFIFGLAHGFVSPGLFILVGAVLYDRCGSRIINYYKGLSNIMPLFALFFLIMVFGNMGVPLTGNFIGEFLSLLGAYQQNIFIASIGAISVILSAIYSIFMYNRVSSGSISKYIHTIPDIFRKEFYLLLPLLVLTIILGIYPSFISNEIEFSLSNFLF
jgi:NADH-ubiquinone oxidoreductase chain 4